MEKNQTSTMLKLYIFTLRAQHFMPSLIVKVWTKNYIFMLSLWGVGVPIHVHVSNYSKTTRPRDMLGFFLKIPYLLRMKNCSRHADLFVRLFARAITSEVPLTLSVKMSTLYHNFLIDLCRDFSHIVHKCTRPQVDSLVWVSGLDLS